MISSPSGGGPFRKLGSQKFPKPGRQESALQKNVPDKYSTDCFDAPSLTNEISNQYFTFTFQELPVNLSLVSETYDDDQRLLELIRNSRRQIRCGTFQNDYRTETRHRTSACLAACRWTLFAHRCAGTCENTVGEIDFATVSSQLSTYPVHARSDACGHHGDGNSRRR